MSKIILSNIKMSYGDDNFDFFENNSPFSPEVQQESPISALTTPKKAGRKKKPIWEYFEAIGTIKSGHSGAKCLYCLKEWKNSKPTELEDHIALHCTKVVAAVKSVFLQVVKSRMRDIQETQETTTTTLDSTITTSTSSLSGNKRRRTQVPVTSYYEPLSIDSAKEARCTRSLTKFFVCCGIPFATVEHPFFLDFVKSLCPAYKSPGRNYLSTSLINIELANIQVTIDEELESEKNLTLGKSFYLYLLKNIKLKALII
jgi:hypothetical protein